MNHFLAVHFPIIFPAWSVAYLALFVLTFTSKERFFWINLSALSLWAVAGVFFALAR